MRDASNKLPIETEAPAQAGEGAVWRRWAADLASLTKARLSFLVVLTALFGYAMAVKGAETFAWGVFLDLLVGVTLATLGAAVFNQLMEVEADAKMARTSDRPLPANRLPKPAAFILGWLLCAFGLIHLGVKVNIASCGVAAATLLTYLFVYTPLKRVSSSNTVVGAVSGALPPLIGWAGGGGSLWSAGAAFLFLLLFFWQLPHFAAINWMYREQYRDGGFVMWSNEDPDGRKTARIALACAFCTALLGAAFPLAAGLMSPWAALPGGALGAVMVLLAWRFLRGGRREEARRLFFYTLLYLPLMMSVAYLSWR